MSDRRTHGLRPTPDATHASESKQAKLGLPRRGLSTAEVYRLEAQLKVETYYQCGNCPAINDIVLALFLNGVLLPKFEKGEVATADDAALIRELISDIKRATRAEWPAFIPDEEGISRFEDDPLDNETLLRRALDPNDYAYDDYYREPPVAYDGGTSGGALHLGITERMVIRRTSRIKRLIRTHGERVGWSEERIKTKISSGAAVMLDRDDPRISKYVNL